MVLLCHQEISRYLLSPLPRQFILSTFTMFLKSFMFLLKLVLSANEGETNNNTGKQVRGTYKKVVQLLLRLKMSPQLEETRPPKSCTQRGKLQKSGIISMKFLLKKRRLTWLSRNQWRHACIVMMFFSRQATKVPHTYGIITTHFMMK